MEEFIEQGDIGQGTEYCRPFVSAAAVAMEVESFDFKRAVSANTFDISNCTFV